MATGLSLNYLERLEGSAIPKVHMYTVEKIADALLVSLDDLTDESPPPEPPPPLPPVLAQIADLGGFLIAWSLAGLFVVVLSFLATQLVNLPVW